MEPIGSAPEAALVRVPRAQPEVELPRTAAELGRLAAESLNDQLDVGLRLLGKCEDLAFLGKGDRTKAIFAAARLMQANTNTARAVAPAASGETRHRSIVETVPGPAGPPGIVDRQIDSILEIAARRTLALAQEDEEDANEERAEAERVNAKRAEYAASANTPAPAK